MQIVRAWIVKNAWVWGSDEDVIIVVCWGVFYASQGCCEVVEEWDVTCVLSILGQLGVVMVLT